MFPLIPIYVITTIFFSTFISIHYSIPTSRSISIYLLIHDPSPSHTYIQIFFPSINKQWEDQKEKQNDITFTMMGVNITFSRHYKDPSLSHGVPPLPPSLPAATSKKINCAKDVRSVYVATEKIN